MRKVLIILLSVFIAFSPLLTLGNFSFAAYDDYPTIGGGGASGNAWINIETQEDIVAAFKAYCKRQNTDISHVPNVVKAIVNWDYSELQKWAVVANVDLDSLNANIWYTYDNNGLLKFFYSHSALVKLQSIYAAIINEHNITYNDSKTVYQGEYYWDGNNNGCFVYMNYPIGDGAFQSTDSYASRQGTFYLYTAEIVQQEMGNNTSLTKTLNLKADVTYDVTFYKTSAGGRNFITVNTTNTSRSYIYKNGGTANFRDGNLMIVKSTNNTYYLGTICHVIYSDTYNQYDYSSNLKEITAPATENGKVDITNGDEPEPLPNDKSMEVQTNDTTINNYITNNDSHDTYNYYDDDDPPKKKPDPLPPTDNFPTGVSDPNGNPFNFTMPNIGIDWNLNLDVNNLPFPFSIPHDIIRFLTILDSEPEAPKYEIHTEVFNTPVNLDIDLSVFDDGMAIIRTLVLIGYVIFLIISTRALFHIY